MTETKQNAITLASQGLNPDQISQKTKVDKSVVESWLCDTENAKRSLEEKFKSIRMMISSHKESGITIDELIPQVKSQLLIASSMIIDLMTHESIITNVESTQCLHIHSKTINELKQIVKDLESANSSNMAAMFYGGAKPINGQINEDGI